jgi:NADH-quinone oxidoreductase subunit D
MRVLMRTDGELVTGAQPHLGYLHRCAEKIGENVEWLQYLPYTDRYDYLASMNNNLGYSLAVEALLGVEIPRRATLIRIICAELNRIGSHLVAFGTYGLDIGAFTPFLYTFREREWMMALFEKICGARLTYSYIRIGGVFNDAPPGWFEEVARFCDVFDQKWQEYVDLLLVNQIYVKRTARVGVISREMALDFGLTGTMLRGSGIDWDLRRDMPYMCYGEIWRDGAFKIPVARGEMGELGDCWDRSWVRVMEMVESIKIVRWCLDHMVDGPVIGELPKTLKVPVPARPTSASRTRAASSATTSSPTAARCRSARACAAPASATSRCSRTRSRARSSVTRSRSSARPTSSWGRPTGDDFELPCARAGRHSGRGRKRQQRVPRGTAGGARRAPAAVGPVAGRRLDRRRDRDGPDLGRRDVLRVARAQGRRPHPVPLRPDVHRLARLAAVDRRRREAPAQGRHDPARRGPRAVHARTRPRAGGDRGGDDGLPLAPGVFFADLDLGVFFVLAMSSMTTIGVVMAGWASNSKWTVYGAMREAAQVVAYEIPLGVSLLVPVMVAGTLNLNEASAAQADYFGMGWFLFKNPFMLPAFVLFFIAALAETKRAPFDLPEAESELVAGFMTEYSGIRWSFFFMEEYAAMFLMSAVAAVFFLGGFESPLTHFVGQAFGKELFVQGANGATELNLQAIPYQAVAGLTLLVKTFAGIFLMMWLRWTLPRIRVDQVMTMGYKYLTPLALVCAVGAALWEAGKQALSS